jgi:hypothetical protein
VSTPNENAAVQAAAEPSAPKVVIGLRWKPGAIERRDDETGFYEAINPGSGPMKFADLLIQDALLMPVRNQAARERYEAAFNARRVGRARGVMA